MIGVLIVGIFLLSGVQSAVPGDLMQHVPGYPTDFNTAVYSGYLNVGSQTRQLHYIFVQSRNGKNNKDPVTLWLNGGPGCSSMLGFIQQIGPYYLQDGQDYKKGDNLTQNKYSWHHVSNLLFLQSPAGVGFSYNIDTTMEYNDAITADDNMKALLDFFSKYPEYVDNSFWIAGESYAGKYIPDLAVLIDIHNSHPTNAVTINMKGIHVGNGVMHLSKMFQIQIQFLIEHSFIDPDLLPYWKQSCQFDQSSAGCRFFKIKTQQNTQQLNPYSVYGFCYYNDSNGVEGKKLETQQSLLWKTVMKARNQSNAVYRGAPCLYFDGVQNYFNAHTLQYKVKFQGQRWNGPCASNISYSPDPEGSILSYRYLLGRAFDKNYQISMYNGNWDKAVPLLDTLAGIKQLGLQQSMPQTPWFTNGQHSGFSRLFSGVILHSIKGASHMAPQSKRAQSQNLFHLLLSGHNFTKHFQAPKTIIQQF